MRGQSSNFSSGVAERAVMDWRTPRMTRSTSGCAVMLRYQSGSRSSPPLEATSTTVVPSTTGAVNIVEWIRPDVRPTVNSSTAGMPNADPPIRPRLACTIERCVTFSARKPKSLIDVDNNSADVTRNT